MMRPPKLVIFSARRSNWRILIRIYRNIKNHVPIAQNSHTGMALIDAEAVVRSHNAADKLPRFGAFFFWKGSSTTGPYIVRQIGLSRASVYRALS